MTTPSVALQRHHSSSKELRDYVAAQSGDTCILSFSLGKDSICAWAALQPHFKTMVPFYLYLIPDLEFVDAAIRYYEERFQTTVIRVPHPSLYRMLTNMTYQPPERCKVIADQVNRGRLDPLDYHVVERYVRWKIGRPEAFVAVGTRTADSPIRLANMKQHGSLHPKRRSFWAIFDWKIADIEACLRRENLRLPVDYDLFGRSFDGVDWRFLAPIKERFPRDYERILEWFPMADADIFRRACAAKEGYGQEGKG